MADSPNIIYQISRTAGLAKFSALAIICAIMLIQACTNRSIAPTGSYQYLYDYESRDLHPEYVLYHHSKDSSSVYFRVFSGELLYTRLALNTPFTTQLKLKATVSDENGITRDTLSISLHERVKDRQGWLVGSMQIPMSEGKWNLLMEFTDRTRNLTQPSFIQGDKSSITTAQNYLITKYETGEPVFGGFVTPGQKVEIISERNGENTQAPSLWRFNTELKLPPPPFSSAAPDLPTLEGAQAIPLVKEGLGIWSFEVAGGLYFFTHDPNRKSGLCIKTSGTHYPKVKDVNALEWPLRFITTKTEHEEIVKNAYPKSLIDRFWLECGGSKEHARELIRVFYRRVEEANYYFSTYTEGWRTDRGMIHLLFGNPNQIVRTSQGEVWNYGEDQNAALLSFNFRKVESPWTNNLYILEREPGYKPYWERMVQTWRSGKIYSE
ncbi:MAG: GWxTD domain-containing protein [Flavobacteriales bacterium]